MDKFRVTPVNIRNGAEAPYYVVSVQKSMKIQEQKDNAVKQARSLSRLSEFDSWSFEVEKI